MDSFFKTVSLVSSDYFNLVLCSLVNKKNNFGLNFDLNKKCDEPLMTQKITLFYEEFIEVVQLQVVSS